jgi:RHS repeat-associated protein
VLDLQSGELVEASTYYPNGAHESYITNTGGDDQAIAPEPMGFTGKEGDEEVGLTYFGERYLISRIGRWASPDPLQIHASGGGEVGNSYHYVSGNLLKGRDPIGLDERVVTNDHGGCMTVLDAIDIQGSTGAPPEPPATPAAPAVVAGVLPGVPSWAPPASAAPTPATPMGPAPGGAIPGSIFVVVAVAALIWLGSASPAGRGESLPPVSRSTNDEEIERLVDNGPYRTASPPPAVAPRPLQLVPRPTTRTGPTVFNPQPDPPRSGPVHVGPPFGSPSPDAAADSREYVRRVNAARRSLTLVRQTTSGHMERQRQAATRAARRRMGCSSWQQAGHVPDVLWTGQVNPPAARWFCMSAQANTSVGAQQRQYPIGWRPTGFIFHATAEAAQDARNQQLHP